MSNRPLLYYITDRTAFSGDEPTRRRALLAKIADAARAGIDYIQLREKDLPPRDLETLATEALSTIRDTPRAAGHQPLATLRTDNWELETVLFINSRTDIALATGANGVHLPANDISPPDVRRLCTSCGADAPVRVTISKSCHSPQDVHEAARAGADLAIFAPVFEKKDGPATTPAGLDALRAACRHEIPVIALGGITLKNAAACLQAGAAGIAAIRLFQEHDIAEVVRRVREL
jgi:thiamine-phosphate pyrophosphorylase